MEDEGTERRPAEEKGSRARERKEERKRGKPAEIESKFDLSLLLEKRESVGPALTKRSVYAHRHGLVFLPFRTRIYPPDVNTPARVVPPRNPAIVYVTVSYDGPRTVELSSQVPHPERSFR